MKRHDNLQPLSRQHHNELMACLLLKKGIKKQASLKTMQDFTRQFWQHDLKHHVELEEKMLIPFLQSKPSLKKYVHVLHNDHQLMERIFDRSQDGLLSYRTLELFAGYVEDHIRFEERVVFAAMQEAVPEEEWKDLFFDDTRQKDCATYTEKFWE
jgi:hemerythrin-like domain-containing protein